MLIRDAQREVRTVFFGGFAGQLVSGIIWLLSAALATWLEPVIGIWVLVAGGFFTFPLTQLVLRLMGRRPTLSAENRLNGLAMQVAFTLPLNLPLVAAATFYRLDWFYPAFMIALGTHYLPFVFLYGMPHFAALAALLIGGGLALALYIPGPFALGGWLTGLVLVMFAFAGALLIRREGRLAAG
ncbi:MAG TPA: hypothetical protein VLC95_06315 [Anaerolineae bacterium]|nr:hypothetical protein [Anaerolineae bacterium]